MVNVNVNSHASVHVAHVMVNVNLSVRVHAEIRLTFLVSQEAHGLVLTHSRCSEAAKMRNDVLDLWHRRTAEEAVYAILVLIDSAVLGLHLRPWSILRKYETVKDVKGCERVKQFSYISLYSYSDLYNVPLLSIFQIEHLLNIECSSMLIMFLIMFLHHLSRIFCALR